MKVSNPDKLIFPEEGITKADLVGYYRGVAEVMLPHLEGRPLTLERYPDGIGEEGFLQKNASRHFPAELIGRVEVPKEKGKVNHPLVSSAEGVIYLANQGTVAFHIWTTRLPHLDRPDRLVFDLDPPEGEVAAARFAASAVSRLLDELGLPRLLMATGGKGYHVVTPVRQDLDLDAAGRLARLLAGVVAARHPDRLTVEFRIRNREGRVFVDWLRNRWAQHSVAPWSLRARPGAPVAAPLRWEELEQVEPSGVTLAEALRRAEQGDPWKGKSDEVADLAALAPRIESLAEEAGVSAEEPFDRFRS